MTNERPTPETDAAQHEGLLRTNPIPMQLVTANFARKLERERDEAREKAERYRLEANAMMMQRDEAREALKHIGEYGTEEINAAVSLRQKLAQALVDLDNMQDQRDLAMKVIKRLEQERDEVRGALAYQFVDANKMVMAAESQCSQK